MYKRPKSLSSLLIEHGYYDEEFYKRIDAELRIPVAKLIKVATTLVNTGYLLPYKEDPKAGLTTNNTTTDL